MNESIWMNEFEFIWMNLNEWKKWIWMNERNEYHDQMIIKNEYEWMWLNVYEWMRLQNAYSE
jgi:hypothetical protein